MLLTISFNFNHGHDRITVGFITTYAISANVKSSNPNTTRSTRYNIM